MELSKTQKILLGIASAWPLVYIFVFIVFIFAMIALSAGGPGGGGDLNPFLGGGFVVLMVVHMITILLTLALTVFYIVHAVKNTRLENNMRIIWIVLFFLGGMIAHPIYWYLQIWKEPQPFIDFLEPPIGGWITEEEWRRKTSERPDWLS